MTSLARDREGNYVMAPVAVLIESSPAILETYVLRAPHLSPSASAVSD